MADLHNVIRLHRWRLEEKQRALADLRSLETQLREEAARLEEEIKAEQAAARAVPEAALTYGSYAVAAIARRGRIAQSIAQVQQRIAAAAEEMATVFQEMKRYEIAQEERDRRRRAEARRKEDAMLDETALAGFNRRRRDEGPA